MLRLNGHHFEVLHLIMEKNEAANFSAPQGIYSIFALRYCKLHMIFYGDQSKFRGRPRMQVSGDFRKINHNNSFGKIINLHTSLHLVTFEF